MNHNLTASVEHAYVAPRNVKPFVMTADQVRDVFDELHLLGISLDEQTCRKMMDGLQKAAASVGMDSLTSTLTQGSIGTPIQFLQNWLAGFVMILTQARKIDQLVGMSVSGAWEDEQVVQGIMEQTGLAVPYGDLTNVPFSSWNVNFVYRNVVRGEEGMQVGILEEARAARMRVNSAEGKREAASLALEIFRNNVGFSGFNSGNNLTYGFLNDPNLPAYVAAPNGGWATATFLEIQQDLLTSIAALRTNSGDQIDPRATQITLAVATNCVDYLSTTSDFGISVTKWLADAYPNVRVESAPQLNLANGGANVYYMYAEQVQDSSTDGGRVWLQVVPTKFKINGVEKLAKGYQESYGNATAGTMCKRPFAVYRCTGI